MIALMAPETPKPGDILQRITGSGEVVEASRLWGSVTVAWEHEVAAYGASYVRERIEMGDWHHVSTDSDEEGAA